MYGWAALPDCLLWKEVAAFERKEVCLVDETWKDADWYGLPPIDILIELDLWFCTLKEAEAPGI